MSITYPCNCSCHTGTGTPDIPLSPNGCATCWANHPQFAQPQVNVTIDYNQLMITKLDEIIELLEKLLKK